MFRRTNIRPVKNGLNKARERWNDKGEINKGLAMASELHPWRFELEIFPSRLPCGHVFEPKLTAQQGAICEAFFFFEML